MATIIAQELKKWKDTLNIDELNPFDITVVNIILQSYEALIEAGGTAGGKRIKKFAELVSAKQGKCDSKLLDMLIRGSATKNRIKRVISLEVNSFRGFATSRTFNLGRQYVLLYGPNGSGKTSFSEALEYGLLGNIEEAEADHIKLSTYIKNTSTNKGVAPIIRCLFENEEETEASEDYETYRFAFIEKNRITDFSHISGLNAKNQNERMAALFGLSEFSSFVQEFTKNFDDRYLLTKSVTEESFKEQQAVIDGKKKELSELENELEKINGEINKVIEDLNKKHEGIGDIQQAIDYYDNADNGLLTKKIQNKNIETVKPIENEKYKLIKTSCNEIISALNLIIYKRNELANKAMELNYKQLYESITKLGETEECPACGTPISKAERNPYLFAKEKLEEYKEIDSIKRFIMEKASECRKSIDELKLLFETNKELLDLLEISTFGLVKVAATDIEKYEKSVEQWFALCKNIAALNDVDVETKIKAYNADAEKKNNVYSQELEKLRGEEKELVTLSAQLSEKGKKVERNRVFITNFDNNSAVTLKKIEEERKQAEYNIKIMKAYQKIVLNLYEYTGKLPELIAQDLESKIVDYYNVINKGDADFEMLSDIFLPSDNCNRLTITFRDGNISDALQVLSEGHIKILGLSILLAKAIKNNLNFIIFDDIVNAIDDEHRNGVANLIMCHEDFQNKQIILSTHGEQFILKLKDRLGTSRISKDAIVYKFLPAEALQERGVVVEYSDAKTPIEAAKKKYEDNELKDAASKCRQAMESVSYNLWNKISDTSNGEILVAMRSPKSQPDLASIVNALIKKSKKIQGMESITEKLEAIKEQDNWRVLNKGTHFENEQPEFERLDVKNVLDILTALDESVRKLKIQESAFP
ncbi:MAG: AAA family ATPase [Lachnospiraceae bacterium]|nr:AAA family ATPase [Lachnospiraceae bacterium]